MAGIALLVPGALVAWECIEPRAVMTSEVMVQVFDGAGPLDPVEGVGVELTGVRGNSIASGKTDVKGYVHFIGVPPGRYRVRWRLAGYPPSGQDLRVMRGSEWPKRVLAVGLTPMCQRVCAVVAPEGALKKAPKCL